MPEISSRSKDRWFRFTVVALAAIGTIYAALYIMVSQRSSNVTLSDATNLHDLTSQPGSSSLMRIDPITTPTMQIITELPTYPLSENSAYSIPTITSINSLTYLRALTRRNTRIWTEPDVHKGTWQAVEINTIVKVYGESVQGPIRYDTDAVGEWYFVEVPIDQISGWIWEGRLTFLDP